MKPFVFLFFFTVACLNTLFSQDTLVTYFDKDWNEISNKDVALYYRNAYADSNKMWIVNDYFMSKQLQMSGYYTSRKLKVMQGNFIFYHENGKVASEGRFYNNKIEGVWNYWYENGNREMSGKYVNDLHHGDWSFWHENGEKKSTGSYIAGFAEGIWEYWYESGEKRAEGKQLNGNKAGDWKYWYTNGELNLIETYSKGEVTSAIGYFENGKINFKGNLVKEKRHGEWTFWNADGRLFFKGAYKNGKNNGEWIRYFPEGEMKIIYVNGVQQDKTLGGIVRIE